MMGGMIDIEAGREKTVRLKARRLAEEATYRSTKAVASKPKSQRR
jgi:hypothetical protein